MAPTGRSSDVIHTQEEAALFDSLCLLDVRAADGGRLIDWHRAMFRKPNARALECVLHHVYCVTNGRAAAKKYFKGLWPLVDKDRKQSKDFYQRAQEWLKEEGQLDAHGNSLAPFQRNPSGHKLVSFLCDLTEIALRAQHERMFPDDMLPDRSMQDDQLLTVLAEPLLAAARAQSQLGARALLQACQCGAQLQAQAEAVAAQLREHYYSLTARLQAARAQAAAAPDVGWSQGGAQPVEMPVHLQQQLVELQELWSKLDGHLQGFASLPGLVASLSGEEIHPHAIDGAVLRQCGQLPGAPSTDGLDIAAMLEAWLLDIGAVCRFLQHLAGTSAGKGVGAGSAPLAAGAAGSGGTWGSYGGGVGSSSSGGGGGGDGGGSLAGGARSIMMTPLVASSDACSHAPHLYAQLGLHKSCLDQLRGLRSAVSVKLAATAERIQRLETAVYGAMAEEEARCMAALAEQQDTDGEQRAVAALQPDTAPSSMFAPCGLQLVPPTPLLEQLVQAQQQRQQAQQQLQQEKLSRQEETQQQARRQADSMDDKHGATVHPARQAALPSLALLTQQQCAGSSSTSSSPEVPAAGALQVQESPRIMQRNRPAQSGRPSSMNSADAPAAALLMSADIMDLGLLDESSDGGAPAGDDGDDAHNVLSPGSPCRATGRRHAVQSPANSAALRLSLVRVSFAPEQLMLGAAAEGACGAAAAAAATEAGEASQLSFRVPPLHAGDGSLHGAAAAGSAADDTPPQVGQGSSGGGEEQVERAPDSMATASELSAPLMPPGLPGSDCFSSARPRRLTFAAAADSAGGASGASAPSDEDDEGASKAECTPELQQPRAAPGVAPPTSMMSALRQRFASVMH